MSNHKTDAQPIFLRDVLTIDYLTLTSFEVSAWEHWSRLVREQEEETGKEAKAVRMPRYEGWSVGMADGGAVTLVSGIQKNKDHIMLQLSGNAAERYKSYAEVMARAGWGEVKRIDLQITVMVDDWCQWRFFNRMKANGKASSMISSKSGRDGRELTTVYLGSRTSERFTRVYEKEGRRDDVYLRWETEYKGARARAVAKAVLLAEDGGYEQAVARLLYEVQSSGDDAVRSVYEPHLTGVRPETDRLHVVRGETKTERWLLSQCLPAFTRVINSHSSDDIVLDAFMDEIKRHMTKRVSGGMVSWPIEEMSKNEDQEEVE